MAIDRYRVKLSDAQWTWREEKVCPYHGPSRHKDRKFGRNDKRSARQADRRETESLRNGQDFSAYEIDEDRE